MSSEDNFRDVYGAEAMPTVSIAARMFIRPWRIRFQEPVEAKFRESYLNATLRRIRVAASLALVLFASFILLDLFTLGQTLSIFGLFIYFGVIIPTLSFLFLASYLDKVRPYLSAIIWLAIFVVGVAVYGLIVEARLHGMLFPAESLILITLFGYFLSGLMLHHAVMLGMALFAVYVWGETSLGLVRFPGYYDIFYLLAANGIGYAGCFFIEYTLRREYRTMQALSRLATRDELTGLRNRRRFEAHFTRLWRHAIREKAWVSMMILDVDYFKAYNDHYGHPAGDVALRKVAEAISAEIHRPLDMAARYGGEEFAVLWYDCAPEVVNGLTDRLLLAVQGIELEHAKSSVANRLTISVGAAVTLPTDGLDPTEFLLAADNALYDAKHAGRNRASVRLWPEVEITQPMECVDSGEAG